MFLKTNKYIQCTFLVLSSVDRFEENFIHHTYHVSCKQCVQKANAVVNATMILYFSCTEESRYKLVFNIRVTLHLKTRLALFLSDIK